MFCAWNCGSYVCTYSYILYIDILVAFCQSIRTCSYLIKPMLISQVLSSCMCVNKVCTAKNICLLYWHYAYNPAILAQLNWLKPIISAMHKVEMGPFCNVHTVNYCVKHNQPAEHANTSGEGVWGHHAILMSYAACFSVGCAHKFI